MSTSKFSLADLITVLGAVTFGYYCFLSLNFLSLGETLPSILWAAVIAFLLGGLALGAKLLKKTSRKFKTCIIWEWVLLLSFWLVALFALFPFSHYFAVSAEKEVIQEKIITNITQAQGMFTAYEKYSDNRENIYKNTLGGVVAAKEINPNQFHQFGFVDIISPDIQSENKIFILKKQLFPSNYAQIKNRDSTWLAEAKKTIANWKPLGIVPVVNDVNVNVEKWRSELKTFTVLKAKGEGDNDIDLALPTITPKDVTSKFTTLGNPTTSSILIAIGLYLLMLLSYFVSKRHSKYPGLKTIFRIGNTTKNTKRIFILK